MKYKFADSIQRGILYLLKNDLSFFTEINALIKPEYFEHSEHQKLYKLIRNHIDKYKGLPSDDIILDSIKQSGEQNIERYEDELIFIKNLEKLATDNRDYYLDIIEKFAKRQELVAAVKYSVLLIQEEKYDQVEEVVKKAVLVGRNVDTGMEYFSTVEERWDRLTAVKTGDRLALGTYGS